MLEARVTLGALIKATVTPDTWEFAGGGAWKTHLVNLDKELSDLGPGAGRAGDPIPQWARED